MHPLTHLLRQTLRHFNIAPYYVTPSFQRNGKGAKSRTSWRALKLGGLHRIRGAIKRTGRGGGSYWGQNEMPNAHLKRRHFLPRFSQYKSHIMTRPSRLPSFDVCNWAEQFQWQSEKGIRQEGEVRRQKVKPP
jgi:hypothetical protein